MDNSSAVHFILLCDLQPCNSCSVTRVDRRQNTDRSLCNCFDSERWKLWNRL